MTTTCMRRRRDDNQLQEVVWHPPHSLLFTGKVIIISFFSFIIITRSCAGLRAADLDWIQFGRVHFGVFSMSRFVPPALSSNWTWPALSSSSIISHLSYVRLDRWALLTVGVWCIFIFVLFPLYRSTGLAELWGTVKSCQFTQMVEIRYVSQEQDDINWAGRIW